MHLPSIEMKLATPAPTAEPASAHRSNTLIRRASTVSAVRAKSKQPGMNRAGATPAAASRAR